MAPPADDLPAPGRGAAGGPAARCALLAAVALGVGVTGTLLLRPRREDPEPAPSAGASPEARPASVRARGVAGGGGLFPPHEADRDPYGRRPAPGDPWEVHVTHLEGSDRLAVTTWRMDLAPAATPSDEDLLGPVDGAWAPESVVPQVFAFFVVPRSNPDAVPDRLYVVLRAGLPIWEPGAWVALRTASATLPLAEPAGDDPAPLRSALPGPYDADESEQRVAGGPARDVAAALREGVVAIEVGSSSHPVPPRAAAVLRRLAERVPRRRVGRPAERRRRTRRAAESRRRPGHRTLP